jgi:hypothetical protein
MKNPKIKLPNSFEKLTVRQKKVGATAAKISVLLAKSGLTTQESTTVLLALVHYGMTRLGVMEMAIGSDIGQLEVHRTPTTKEPGKKIPEETPSYIR